MLIEYYGKLPHKSEFVSAAHLSSAAWSLVDWISRGQDHLGEPSLLMRNRPPCAYFFCGNSSAAKAFIAGVLFDSCDSKSRRYPFFVFHHNSVSSYELLSCAYHRVLDEVELEMQSLNQTMTTDELLERFWVFLDNYQSYNHQANNHQADDGLMIWQDILSGRKMSANKLTGILFRKLMTGDII